MEKLIDKNSITKDRLKEQKANGVYHGDTLMPPVNSIQYLLNGLLPDERIIKLVSCNLERKAGILGITTSRAIFVQATSTSVGVTKDFLLKSLSSVNIQAGLVNSLYISTSNDKMEVKAIPASDLQEVVKALRSPESFKSFSVEEVFPDQSVSVGPATGKVKDGKKSGSKTLRYIGSVFLLLMGISWMATVSNNGIYICIAGFFILIIGLSIAPPMSRFFVSKLRKQAAVGSLAAALLFMIVGVNVSTSEDEAQNAEADKSFLKVKELISANKLESAAFLAKTVKNQYADTVNNPAALFLNRYDSISSKEFFNHSLLGLTDKDFQDLKAGNFKKAFVKDSVLNASFISSLMASADQRENLIQEKRLNEEIAREKAEYAERQKQIEKQFSPYDGSHRNLEKIIKSNMNDEDSYEHIDTRFSDTGDYIIVKTTFSGKNAFNATVKQAVRAKVAIDGTVLSYEVIE